MRTHRRMAIALLASLVLRHGALAGVDPATLTVAYAANLWPKVKGVATVYYTIDEASDPNAAAKIAAAIATFNADFPGVIHWIPWKSGLGPNYVDINLSASDTTGVCEANEGYEAVPAQPMTGSTACTIGTILHEMGHVIGLWHEQSRTDRDIYVSVSYANVIKGSWSNYQIQTADDQVLGFYDYASVMQYIPFAFSRNGGPVIESIPAGIPLAGYAGVPAKAGAKGTPALPVFDYSAGDKETIRRLYGAAPDEVTVTSNPVGLKIIVDGMTVTTPQVYAWALNSTHTLGVPDGVQSLSGAVLNSNPAVPATFYYTYGRWNDSTEQNHSITIAPGGGSGAFPTSSPQSASYSANFIQLVPYAAAVYPNSTGTVKVAPQPQRYAGSTRAFLVARQTATLTAGAAEGWTFYEFNNSPFWLPGGLGANPKEFYVPDTGNPVNTTAEFSDKPVFSVGIEPASFSSGTYVYVDENFAYAPKNFSSFYDKTWTAGSTHSLSLDAAEYPYSINSRFAFSNWSDAGARTHNIASLPDTAAGYIAMVTPEYRPAGNFGGTPCGGTASVEPASPTGDGFYPAGQSLTLTAGPDLAKGWLFGGWTGDLTGSTNPASLTADDETLVNANFNIVDAPLTLTTISPQRVRAGGPAFVLTLAGSGFSKKSQVYADGKLEPATYVNAQTLTVPIEAADIAQPGAFQIYVENFPAGWKGCAVFGYQTLLVTGPAPPRATSP